jgi:hypothetical protein
MNIATVHKKPSKIIVFLLGLVSFAFLATGAGAATNVAILNVGESYEDNDKESIMSIQDRSSTMTVAHGGGDVFQLRGEAHKYVFVLPDPIVHYSWARPQREVVTRFSPEPTSYYAAARSEYGATSIWGSVKITN